MFIIRTDGARPCGPGVSIRQTRRTPSLAAGGTHDFFCDGDPNAARAAGLNVVPVHDGWYADDTGGGVAVWGQGRFWEIRDTPFTVRESDAAAPMEAAGQTPEIVNVRNAIFGV
jgi:hypothetical protein